MVKYLVTRTTLLVCAWLLVCSVNLLADDTNSSLSFVDENKKRVAVEELLQLKNLEAEVFWPIYDDYSKEIAKIHLEFFHLIQNFQEKNNNHELTDELADIYLDKAFDIEIRKWTIKKKYKEKFKQALQSKDVARFFQFDNKIDIQLLYKLSNRIDMIK